MRWVYFFLFAILFVDVQYFTNSPFWIDCKSSTTNQKNMEFHIDDTKRSSWKACNNNNKTNQTKRMLWKICNLKIIVYLQWTINITRLLTDGGIPFEAMHNIGPMLSLSAREIENDDPLMLGTFVHREMRKKNKRNVCINSNN